MTDTPAQYFAGLAADSFGGVDVQTGTASNSGTSNFGTANGRPPLVLLHGLTYDRRQWGPALRELALIDPDRRVLALDLPGHGDSPRRDSYPPDEVVTALHAAVTEAGLDAPILVGHSLGGVLATIYAATYPARGVVNLDQPLLPGGFVDLLRRVEPVLRSPAYGQVWDSLLARMQIDVLPAAAQELVRTATTPRQDLLLGYWNELLVTPAEAFAEHRTRELDAIRERGIAYHHVSGSELDPAYTRWLQAALPDVTVTVLPGGGHFVHLAHPAELAKILAG